MQERLGHATAQVTLDIYSYVLPAMEPAAVDAFAALLDDGESLGPASTGVGVSPQPRLHRQIVRRLAGAIDT